MDARLVYLGLGANLENPLLQLERAMQAIACLPGTRVCGQSAYYQTKPVGTVLDQPDFINAVVAIETTLSPFALLAQTQAIELAQGRVRTLKWGPRTLDIDLLLYEDESIKTPKLTLPHPHLLTRVFVLKPLAELAPDLILPNGVGIKLQLEQCDPAQLSGCWLSCHQSAYFEFDRLSP